jgi:hypothetical protein
MEYDSTQGFSSNTSPNLFHTHKWGSEYNEVRKGSSSKGQNVSYARDNRYPAYAGKMEDARLVTDYRPQCSKNVRPHYQFHTKLWMINHADELMEEARQRQVEGTGASLGMANTVPPPAAIVHSTPFESEIEPTHFLGGIGVERGNSDAPALFGTFSYEPTIADIQKNRKNVAMTTMQEGGRNSKRGIF